jgi:probable phosphoglycerate mutase
MTQKFYFLRHGQTDFNLNDLVMGSIDMDVNFYGLKQAVDIAQNIRHLNIKTIVSSPLKRALTTSKVISYFTKAPIVVIDNFKEVNYGSLEGAKKPENFLYNWINNEYEDAESFSLVKKRVKEGLNHAFLYQEPILVVSHGGIYKAMQSLLKLPIFPCDNCRPIYHEYNEVNDSWSFDILGANHSFL